MRVYNLRCGTHQESNTVTGSEGITPSPKCALCGHDPACGSASVTTQVGTEVSEYRLCHDDGHSCYHRWTVYGQRPATDDVLTSEHINEILAELRERLGGRRP